MHVVPNIGVWCRFEGVWHTVEVHGTFMKAYGCHTPKRPGENPVYLLYIVHVHVYMCGSVLWMYSVVLQKILDKFYDFHNGQMKEIEDAISDQQRLDSNMDVRHDIFKVLRVSNFFPWLLYCFS